MHAIWFLWRGVGWIVFLIGFGSLLLMDFVTRIAFQDDQYYPKHGWPKLVGFWIAAAITRSVVSYLDHKNDGERIDPVTGKCLVVSEGRHGLFLIPLKHWPLIFFVLGIIFFFVNDG